MSQVNSIDRVIRKVSADTKAKPSTEKIVIIDKKKGKALQKKNFWNVDVAYYLVSNTEDASNRAERQGFICTVTDIANDRKIALSVSYWVSCEPGNEETVAESLYSDNSPGTELDRKIEKWIAKFTRNDAAKFIDGYSVQLAELREFVKSNIKQETGLNIDLKLTLDKEEHLKPYSIPHIQISVHVSDCDDDLDLQLQIELVIDEANKIKAALNYGKELLLVNLIKSEVKRYLLENITLNQFCYELKDAVRKGLIKHLDKALIDKGRKVGYLSLVSNTVSSIPEELLEIKHDVECIVQGYPEPIFVKNTIQLLPQNIARYKSAQSPNLEAWVKGKLEKIVKPLLLDKRYIDILLKFQPVAQDIKQQMQNEAKSIGYDVKHIVSIPNLKPLALKDGVILKKEGTFATKAANVQVKLETIVNAKIDDLGKIERYLNPQFDVKDLMEEAIYNATSEVLNNIEPERFYMRFSHHDSELGENRSVEQELVNKIKEELETRFHAQINSITLKLLDTEITERFRELYGTIGRFDFEVPSLKGREVVRFQGDFTVQGIEENSWYTFQARQPKIDDIKRSIEKSIQAKLSTFASEVLQYRELKDLSAIERIINQWARVSIIDQFGLKISISHVSRTRTGIEEYQSNAWEDLQITQIDESKEHIKAILEQRQAQRERFSRANRAKYDELQKLYEQRLALSGDETNEAELEYLNDQIKELEEEVIKPSIESAENKLQVLQQNREKAKGFFEVAEEQMNLSGGETKPSISASDDADILDKEENSH
jgi:hypothetical protein